MGRGRAEEVKGAGVRVGERVEFGVVGKRGKWSLSGCTSIIAESRLAA